jgi:hypothetical protein
MSKKKDDYYFPHDMGARNDGKIIALRMTHGWQGYGLFWALVETLRAEKNHIYPMKDLPSLAFSLQADATPLEDVIRGYDLFEFKTIDDDEYFYSTRLCNSMEIYNSMKQKRIDAGRKGGLSNAKAKEEQTSGDALAKSSKGKEIKGKEIKGKEYMSDSKEVVLSELLSTLITANDDKAKQPNIQSWSAEIDKLHRIDGRSYDDIEQLIRWTQQDAFEKSNILSPVKLRKRFPQLWLKGGKASINRSTEDNLKLLDNLTMEDVNNQS